MNKRFSKGDLVLFIRFDVSVGIQNKFNHVPDFWVTQVMAFGSPRTSPTVGWNCWKATHQIQRQNSLSNELVSEWASEQMSAAEREGEMSEQCEGTSEQMSEWLIPISRGFGAAGRIRETAVRVVHIIFPRIAILSPFQFIDIGLFPYSSGANKRLSE